MGRKKGVEGANDEWWMKYKVKFIGRGWDEKNEDEGEKDVIGDRILTQKPDWRDCSRMVVQCLHEIEIIIEIKYVDQSVASPRGKKPVTWNTQQIRKLSKLCKKLD